MTGALRAKRWEGWSIFPLIGNTRANAQRFGGARPLIFAGDEPLLRFPAQAAAIFCGQRSKVEAVFSPFSSRIARRNTEEVLAPRVTGGV